MRLDHFLVVESPALLKHIQEVIGSYWLRVMAEEVEFLAAEFTLVRSDS